MGTPASSDTVGLIPKRACRNCVQIKVRCTPLVGSPDNVCQRCHRLGKSCTTPTPVFRKQRAKSNKVKRLEQRIDELTALVVPGASGQLLTPSSDILPAQADEHGTDRNSVAVSGDTAASTMQRSGMENSYREASTPADNVIDNSEFSSQAFPSCPGPSAVQFIQVAGRKDGSQLRTEHFCPVHLGFELESRLFTKFRNEMAKHFPFVVIDDGISAETFKTTKPFAYWACILAASHGYQKLHPLLHDEMLKAIGYRLLVAGDKSLDMLQGLLLMTAWTHNISHLNPQFMNLLHLVQASLADTGLLKPIRIHDKIRVASDTTAFMHGKDSTEIKITTDEKRALLGFYCFSWKAALTFNRIDPMRHSQHIDSCSESLRHESNREGDQLIVEIVHLYRIVGKFFHVDSASANLSPMYRTMFLDEISRFRHSLPTKLVGNQLLELEILGSSVCIIEPSYTVDYPSKVEHLDVFHNCIEIGNQLIEALMSIPNEDYPNATFLVTMTLVQIMTVLCRLSFFKSNSWDTSYSCRNVKLDHFLERMADKYTKIHELETARQPQPQPWRYLIHAQTANRIKDWYRAKVVAEQAVFSSAMDEVMPDTLSGDPFGNFDDSFWQDLLGNWKDF